MHYCIGDVHGCFYPLMQMIRMIEEKDKDARFFLLGDLIDRGPDSDLVLKWAMENIRPGGRYQCLLGNHEDLILQWYYYKFLPWYRKVPSPTEQVPVTKFDFSSLVEKYDLKTPEKLLPLISFLEELPLYRKVTVNGHTFLLVHAWYDPKVTSDILQRKMNLRLRRFTGQPDPTMTIVFGHTPTTDPDFLKKTGQYEKAGKIVHLKGAIDLDGGCVFSKENGYPGHLCGLCLETMEEYYQKL